MITRVITCAAVVAVALVSFDTEMPAQNAATEAARPRMPRSTMALSEVASSAA